jgi:putative acetyltransferase
VQASLSFQSLDAADATLLLQALAVQFMRIRTAINSDLDGIREIHLCAFPEDERQIVSKLAIDLLVESTTPQTICLVAETGNTVVGYVAFSPVKFDCNDNLQGYILAPLAVMPDYQKQRIGSDLVESGIQTLLKAGVNILFVYGDPEYYGKFGFNAENAENFIPQYGLQYPFGWQAIILNEFPVERGPCSIVCTASLGDPKLW